MNTCLSRIFKNLSVICSAYSRKDKEPTRTSVSLSLPWLHALTQPTCTEHSPHAQQSTTNGGTVTRDPRFHFRSHFTEMEKRMLQSNLPRRKGQGEPGLALSGLQDEEDPATGEEGRRGKWKCRAPKTRSASWHRCHSVDKSVLKVGWGGGGKMNRKKQERARCHWALLVVVISFCISSSFQQEDTEGLDSGRSSYLKSSPMIPSLAGINRISIPKPYVGFIHHFAKNHCCIMATG